MEVINELLGRPLLKIYQDPEIFNFSLDSMLLANFVTIPKKTKLIVDLGTGNAPIPLYLTLRTTAKIIGVEIQNYSFILATKSVKINNKEGQIELINADLKGINETIGLHKADVVTCNPPFYQLGSFKQNPDMRKTIARHEVLVKLEDVIKEASLLLNTKGVFALIHRPERLSEIIILLNKYRLEPKRLRFIYPKINSKCNHILVEAVKDANKGSLKVLPPLYIYDDDDKWTCETLKIYNYETEE